MRTDAAVAAAGQAGAPPDSRQYARTPSEHWRQFTAEIRRFDVAMERILRFMEADLLAFVRASNAR